MSVAVTPFWQTREQQSVPLGPVLLNAQNTKRTEYTIYKGIELIPLVNYPFNFSFNTSQNIAKL